MRFYGSLSRVEHGIHVNQYATLNGFRVGNHYKDGCLTSQTTTRLHSCEPGSPCHTKLQKDKQVVWIIPIVTRSREGVMVPEVGAGGGGRDLRQVPELELSNIESMGHLRALCEQQAQGSAGTTKLYSDVEAALSLGDKKISLDGLELGAEKEISLGEFLKRRSAADQAPTAALVEQGFLKSTIHYPYSRHSSYTELCELVATFKPDDIYPCTINEQSWTEAVSMKALFGHLCSGTTFAHDNEMRHRSRCRWEMEIPSKQRSDKWQTDSPESACTDSPGQLDLRTIADFGARPNIPDRASFSPDGEANSPLNMSESVAPRSHLLSVQRLAAIRSAYEAHMTKSSLDLALGNACLDLPRKRKLKSGPVPAAASSVTDSQVSISLSALDSDDFEANEASLVADLQVDRPDAEPASSCASTSQVRYERRLQAYLAARATLLTGQSGAWDDLGIRSVGDVGLLFRGGTLSEQDLTLSSVTHGRSGALIRGPDA
jgi:hypothetical protein